MVVFFYWLYRISFIAMLFALAGGLAVALKWGFWEPVLWAVGGAFFSYIGRHRTKRAIEAIDALPPEPD